MVNRMRRQAASRLKALVLWTVVLLACAGAAVFFFAGQAYASDEATVHVSYQWYSSDMAVTEDLEVFDVPAYVEGDNLAAVVMPEAYELGEGCAWRVMKNFAGGIAAGEREITPETSFDEQTGTLYLPRGRLGENITIVFQMPWEHASHTAHGNCRQTLVRGAVRDISSLLAAQDGGERSATGASMAAGTTYPLDIVSGEGGLDSSPMIYGADSDVAGAGSAAGYPEYDGNYKFYVAFERANCELFDDLEEMPGRQGNGGIVYGSSGTPYDYSWMADWNWCVADCVENVYNGAGMPVPIQGDGSWVRIDELHDDLASCTFRIECDNPDGTNAQDIMGSFTIPYNPCGAISLSKRSADPGLTDGNPCYSLAGAVFGVYATEDAARGARAMDALATYTTDEDGTWESEPEYRPGTYYVTELEAPEGFIVSDEVVRVTVSARETAQVVMTDAPQLPQAEVIAQKRDRETGETTPQGDASFEGAEVTFRYYAGAYYRKADLPATPTRTWVMRTNAQGTASISDGERMRVSGDDFYRDENGDVIVPLGTVTATETKAPDGYALNEKLSGPAVLTWDTDEVMLVVAETVEHGGAQVTKRSRHLNQMGASGDGSLAGATLLIENASENPVVVNGATFQPGSAIMMLSTDENGTAATDENVLPCGTYAVREVRTSQRGYLLDDVSQAWRGTFSIREDGQVAVLDDKDATICNDEMRGNVEVLKVDRDTGGRTAQGDATLAGAEFQIVNRSAAPVASPQTGEDVEPGEVVCTIVTDESGLASTAAAQANGWTMPDDFNGKALAYGTYEIYEVSPPARGYLTDEEWSATFTIRADGQVVALSASDPVMRGQIVVGKVSRETGGYQNQGAADLEGWEFEVVNRSAGPVVVDGATFEAGEVVKTIATGQAGGAYLASTGERSLPYGTYEVREIQTMRPQDNGYLFDDESQAWSQTVLIEADGQIVELADAQTACANQVVRADLQLVKAQGPDMGRLAGIPFRVTSTTTGEWHVVVTDANGQLSTSSDANPHSRDTNANDAAIGEDGTVDESKLNAEAGLWFSGRTDVATEPDESAGALPFDTYTVEELHVSANEGLDLVCVEATVYRDGTAIDLGTLVDNALPVPEIRTALADASGSKAVAAAQSATLVDTVTFDNLDPARAYTLRGELWLVEDGLATQLVASSEQAFSPDATHGSVDMAFEADTSALAGCALVCFEYLYDEDGNEVACHADAADEGQTVSVPAISTTLHDTASGGHYATFEQPGAFALTDTVSYWGLMPGKTYALTGTLHDKETGAAITGENGMPVTATRTFTPDAREGSVDITFSFPLAPGAVRQIVAFESLSYRGVECAVHADLEDGEQTVNAARIGTEFCNADGGGHAFAGEGTVNLQDTVTYEGLEPGRAYVAEATLYDKATGTPVCALQEGGDEAEAIVARVEFAPEEASGSIVVPFSLDAAMLPQDTVCFERVYDANGRIVAVHEDIDDEGQTVTKEDVPESDNPPSEEEPPEPTPPEPTPGEPTPGEAEDKKPAEKATALAKTGDSVPIALIAFILAGAMGLGCAALSIRRLDDGSRITIERGKPRR